MSTSPKRMMKLISLTQTNWKLNQQFKARYANSNFNYTLSTHVLFQLQFSSLTKHKTCISDSVAVIPSTKGKQFEGITLRDKSCHFDELCRLLVNRNARTVALSNSIQIRPNTRQYFKSRFDNQHPTCTMFPVMYLFLFPLDQFVIFYYVRIFSSARCFKHL